VSLTIRELAHDDVAAWRMGATIFGGDRDVLPSDRPLDESTWWGAHDESGRLIGKAVDLHYEQWWGGRLVPTCGVAGVAVEVEQRGRGVTREVMRALLRNARDRGAAVAALFCTTSRVYRAFGFETCGTTRWVDVPTAILPADNSEDIRLRAGDGSDWPLTRQVYDQVARGSNGMLSRRSVRFADPPGTDLPRGIDGVTIAETAAGEAVGYATWDRGRGYDADAVLTVPDCLAVTPAAARALLGVLRSWDVVAPTVRMRRPDWADAVGVHLPLERAQVHRSMVWMHRPVDPVAAVAARGWPDGVDGCVDFRLHDEFGDDNGGWRLTVKDGEGRLEPAKRDPAVTLSVRGWSLLYCGAATAAQLHQAGLVDAADRSELAKLQAILGCGGPAALLDYF